MVEPSQQLSQPWTNYLLKYGYSSKDPTWTVTVFKELLLLGFGMRRVATICWWVNGKFTCMQVSPQSLVSSRVCAFERTGTDYNVGFSISISMFNIFLWLVRIWTESWWQFEEFYPSYHHCHNLCRGLCHCLGHCHAAPAAVIAHISNPSSAPETLPRQNAKFK